MFPRVKEDILQHISTQLKIKDWAHAYLDVSLKKTIHVLAYEGKDIKMEGKTLHFPVTYDLC